MEIRKDIHRKVLFPGKVTESFSVDRRFLRVPRISELDLSQHCSNVQGFFFNINLAQCESELLKIQQLSLSNSVVSNGIIFVPVLKQNISQLIRIMEAKKVAWKRG